MAERPVHGVLAEFSDPAPLIAGAKMLREQGWRIETYTPFPVDGLAEAVGFSESRVPIATLIGALIGALAGFLMQVGVNLDFPLDIGGRPLIAVPAFMLITFETMVLGAVMTGIGAMLVLNRLPKLHHPLFDVDRFGLASDNRFFLAILPDGKAFDAREARAALWRAQPVDVTDICAGEPE